MAKSERLYIRTTPEKKAFLQEIADSDPKYNGEITAVIDELIERLMEEEGEYA